MMSLYMSWSLRLLSPEFSAGSCICDREVLTCTTDLLGGWHPGRGNIKAFSNVTKCSPVFSPMTNGLHGNQQWCSHLVISVHSCLYRLAYWVVFQWQAKFRYEWTDLDLKDNLNLERWEVTVLTSQIFSSVGIQDGARWQFWSSTQVPSLIPFSIIRIAMGPWPWPRDSESNLAPPKPCKQWARRY